VKHPGHTAPRVAVLGGGIVGLATAHALLAGEGGCQVSVLEKEPELARHQSTHNSGVLHSGLYYQPGSHRARLARTGLRRMTEFCQEHGIAHEICGKLVVAVTEQELPRLRALAERGAANGLRGLRWLDPAAARELEPHVRCVGALHVPEEGIVDYRGVCAALAHAIRAAGGEIRTSARVVGLRRQQGRWRVLLPGDAATADFVVNCAAQSADRLARAAGQDPGSRIIPFRGQYYRLAPAAETLIRNLVYPVPDPAFPFLGVHFTRLVGGGREAGPNAVLAFSREGYRFLTINARDLRDTLTWGGFWRFAARHRRMVAQEFRQALSRRRFLAALQRMVPNLQAEDLLPGGAGVRMQALLPDGQLVSDFLWAEGPGALHVLSAPSPAATAALEIGAEIASRVRARLAGG
jgi:L-2-hydroxyglutarate oxidase